MPHRRTGRCNIHRSQSRFRYLAHSDLRGRGRYARRYTVSIPFPVSGSFRCPITGAESVSIRIESQSRFRYLAHSDKWASICPERSWRWSQSRFRYLAHSDVVAIFIRAALAESQSRFRYLAHSDEEWLDSIEAAMQARLNPVSGIWLIPMITGQAKRTFQRESQSRFRYLAHSDAREYGVDVSYPYKLSQSRFRYLAHSDSG